MMPRRGIYKKITVVVRNDTRFVPKSKNLFFGRKLAGWGGAGYGAEVHRGGVGLMTGTIMAPIVKNMRTGLCPIIMFGRAVET